MKKDIFRKTQEKFIRGVYQELDLLTEKEKKQCIFRLALSMKIELLKECQRYMKKESKERYQKYIEKMIKVKNEDNEKDLLVRGVFYLHHHFLNGNSMFTYAVNQCSKRWTIAYLKKYHKKIIIPVDKELLFLGFLALLTEQKHKEEYQVQTYWIEYYLFILEMLGYIKRRGKKIYMKKQAYKKAQIICNQFTLQGKKTNSLC